MCRGNPISLRCRYARARCSRHHIAAPGTMRRAGVTFGPVCSGPMALYGAPRRVLWWGKGTTVAMGTDSEGQEHAVQKGGTEDMRARLRFLSIAVPLVGLAVLYLVRLGLLRIWPVVAVDAALGFLL